MTRLLCVSDTEIRPICGSPSCRTVVHHRGSTTKKLSSAHVRSGGIRAPMDVMGTSMAARRAAVNLFLFQVEGAIHEPWSMKGSPVDVTAARGRISSRACLTISTPSMKPQLSASASQSVRTARCVWRKSTNSPCRTTSSRRSAQLPSAEQLLQPKLPATRSQVSTLLKEAGPWHAAPRTRKVSRSANRETFEECGSNLAVAGVRFEILS